MSNMSDNSSVVQDNSIFLKRQNQLRNDNPQEVEKACSAVVAGIQSFMPQEELVELIRSPYVNPKYVDENGNNFIMIALEAYKNIETNKITDYHNAVIASLMGIKVDPLDRNKFSENTFSSVIRYQLPIKPIMEYMQQYPQEIPTRIALHEKGQIVPVMTYAMLHTDRLSVDLMKNVLNAQPKLKPSGYFLSEFLRAKENDIPDNFRDIFALFDKLDYQYSTYAPIFLHRSMAGVYAYTNYYVETENSCYSYLYTEAQKAHRISLFLLENDTPAILDNNENTLLHVWASRFAPASLDRSGSLFADLLRVCDINATNKRGQTALICTLLKPNNNEGTQKKESKALSLLSCAEINIHIQDNNGKNALIWAVQNGYLKAAKGLLMRGADPLVCDHSGKNTLDYLAELPTDKQKEMQAVFEVALSKDTKTGIQQFKKVTSAPTHNTKAPQQKEYM